MCVHVYVLKVTFKSSIYTFYFFWLKDESFNNEKKKNHFVPIWSPTHLFPLLSDFCIETPGVLSNYYWWHLLAAGLVIRGCIKH